MTASGGHSEQELFNYPPHAHVIHFDEACSRALREGQADLIGHFARHRLLGDKRHTHNPAPRPLTLPVNARPLPKMKADVLFIADLPRSLRVTDEKLTLEILSGLLQLDLSVITLDLHNRKVIEEPQIAAAISSGQLRLVTPYDGIGALRVELMRRKVLKKAQEAHHRMDELLTEGVYLADISLRPEVEVELCRLLWTRLITAIEIDFSIVRDPLGNYGREATWYLSGEDFPVVSLQHGLTSSIHPYVPLLGTQLLTHGTKSARIYRTLNSSLSPSLAPRHAIPHPIGNFRDRLALSTKSQSLRSLLILDQATEWSASYYGFGSELRALQNVADECLDRGVIDSVVVRPHPSADHLESWTNLARKHNSRLRMSHPRLPLEVDLDGATLALSLFSGAAITAAASGIPVYLLSHNESTWFEELSGFQRITIPSSEAVDTVVSTLDSKANLQTLAATGLECATTYFDGNMERRIDSTLIRSLLEHPKESG